MGMCKPCNNIRAKVWQTLNKEKKNQHSKEWRARNQDRVKKVKFANNMIWRALKKGLLVRGTMCVKCGSGGVIEAAHTDYNKPMEIIWLCVKCHRTWDSNQRKS